MSAVASTSDLSKQPKQGSKAKSTASKSKAKDPLGYGYNHLAGNTLIAGFVDNAVQKKLTSFRHFGEVVRNLPFKSALLDEPRPLEEAVGDYAGLFEAGLVGKLNWERITVCYFAMIQLQRHDPSNFDVTGCYLDACFGCADAFVPFTLSATCNPRLSPHTPHFLLFLLTSRTLLMRTIFFPTRHGLLTYHYFVDCCEERERMGESDIHQGLGWL